MKHIWIWMLGIAYGIWTIVSIIDIIVSLRDWINKNIETETETLDSQSNIVPKTITKKKWTGEYDISHFVDELDDSTAVWFAFTLVVMFVVSLGANIISCVRGGT